MKMIWTRIIVSNSVFLFISFNLCVNQLKAAYTLIPCQSQVYESDKAKQWFHMITTSFMSLQHEHDVHRNRLTCSYISSWKDCCCQNNSIIGIYQHWYIGPTQHKKANICTQWFVALSSRRYHRSNKKTPSTVLGPMQ